MLCALALLGACTSFNDLAGISEDLKPSSKPVTVDNLPAGRFEGIGRDQHPRILATYGGAYSDAKLERMLAGIVGRLTTVSDNPGQTYRITILNSPSINAFALPGGYLYITRGLIALANDSAELAAVIAHEMAHVTANHGILRQKKEKEAELANRVVQLVLSDKEEGRKALIRGKLRLAQFSRNQELQADAIGISAMGEAGFDAYAAARFQESMSSYTAFRSISGASDPSLDFLATHPSTPQRVTLALGHARKFGGKGSGVAERDRYLAGIDGMIYGDSAEEGFVRANRFSHPGLGITFAAPAGFEIENRPEAVIATDSSGVAIRFDGVDIKPGTSLTAYIASGWVQGLRTETIRATTVNGLEAATALASAGEWDFDITVIRYKGRVYRLLTAAPRGSGKLSMAAQAARNSFRELTPQERAALRPLHVRIVTASADDTVEKLAARMTGATRLVDLFRVLNALGPNDTVQPGQKVKIIAE